MLGRREPTSSVPSALSRSLSPPPAYTLLVLRQACQSSCEPIPARMAPGSQLPRARQRNPAGGKPVRGSGVRSTIVYACQKADNPFWPIGLCIAWVARQNTAGAIKLFARRRVKRSFQSAEWANARTRLVNGLGAGDVQSSGLLPSGKTHVPIPAVEWMDLQVRQRGPNEDVLPC